MPKSGGDNRRSLGHLARSGLATWHRLETGTLLVEQLKMKRNVEAWELTSRLFRYWHLFHRPLATAMYLLIGLHIVNAVLLGGAIQTMFGL